MNNGAGKNRRQGFSFARVQAPDEMHLDRKVFNENAERNHAPGTRIHNMNNSGANKKINIISINRNTFGSIST